MVFVDPYLLTMTIIFTLLLIFFNIYFVAHFAHFADSAFGSSTACKALIVSIKKTNFLTRNIEFFLYFRFLPIWSLSAKYFCYLWMFRIPEMKLIST